MQATYIRLPTPIRSDTHNITIQTFMEEQDPRLRYTFLGDVRIRIKSTIKTKYLIMHSKDLSYTFCEYWAERAPLVKFKMRKTSPYFGSDRIVFEMKQDLFPNHFYVLHFKYTGVIRNESAGVFWREYNDFDSQHRWLVATQFQPNKARKAFPCFDEPQFKARFRMRIIRAIYMKSFSNSPREYSYPKSGFMVDTFKLTPIMPIYTLAFLIAPYEELSDGNFSVLAKKEDIQQTKLGIEIGKRLLDVLGDFFNISYNEMGVDKLAMAAVPDLNFVGMENWGLVIAERDSLICNEASNSITQREHIASLIAHELAHMWFGNLVTCEWWTSLWLNEGFATYFAYFTQSLIENNGLMEEIFFENVIGRSLSMDISIQNSLTMERKEVTWEYSNSLTYVKGASIIHMVRHIIGEDGFRDSLQNYLHANKYGIVNLDTIKAVWREYWPARFLGYIDEFFSSFVNRGGYPLITVELFENGYKFAISQENFLEALSQVADTSLIFTVPMSLTTNVDLNFSRTAPDFFLSTRKGIYTLSSSYPASWLIANAQATWYYRVNYNRRNWLRVGEALRAPNWSGLPLLSRVKIIDDVEYLFCIGKLDSSLALHVLGYLHTETSYFPWKAALEHIEVILKRARLTRSAAVAFIQNITHSVYSDLGFLEKPTDDSWTLANRNQIIPLACKYGNPACLDKVQFYFSQPEILKNLPNYLRLVIYCSAMRRGNHTEYEKILSLHRNENDEEEKLLLMEALGLLSNDYKIMALEALYSENDSNNYQTYKLIKNNYERASIVFGKETIVAYLLSAISKQFTEIFQKEDLSHFVKTSMKIKCYEAFKILKDTVKNLDNCPLWF